jgi:hypothetical protein
MNKKMTGLEMSDEGYLQEVNRQFFHPLGLAMYVDPETNEMGVFDYREDPEGVAFNSVNTDKVDNIKRIADARLSPRASALGYWVQPRNPHEPKQEKEFAGKRKYGVAVRNEDNSGYLLLTGYGEPVDSMHVRAAVRALDRHNEFYIARKNLAIAEDEMTVKFNKDGKTVAVLKDSAHEPEGITYLADDEALPEDIEVEMDGVKSLEELDEEAKTE